MAHNWMNTYTRLNGGSAASYRPCSGQKPSDLHAQVGPGQDFNVMWSTGHPFESVVRLTVVPAAELWRIGEENFNDLHDQYLAEATSPNLHLDPTYRRFHKSQDAAYTDANAPAGVYPSKITSGPLVTSLAHPRTPGATLYQISDTQCQGDFRYQYTNSKFPWIIMAAKYLQLVSLPYDFDTALIHLDAAQPAGHYVLHWFWSGYTDCTDIDFRTQTVADIYGVLGTPKYKYNRIDHCQFNVLRYLTACNVTLDAIDCKNVLDPVIQNQDGRMGIQVIPWAQPPNVATEWKERINVPFGTNWCIEGLERTTGRLQTVVTGIETESPSDWAAWDAKTNFVNGQTCNSVMWTRTTTLKQAILSCSSRQCVGISVQKATFQPYDTTSGTAVYRGCNGTQSGTTLSGWSVAFKKTVDPDPSTYTVVQEYGVSFQKPGASWSVPNGWVKEDGQVFNKSGGRNYGWTCKPDPYFSYVGTGIDDSAWAVNYYTRCKSDDNPGHTEWTNNWNMEVPNGLYRVSWKMDKDKLDGYGSFDLGCNAENHRIPFTVNYDWSQPAVHYVDVQDGNITIKADAAFEEERKIVYVWFQCGYVHWIKFERLVQTAPSVWFPSSANPWWQLEMPTPQPVGPVSIKNRDQYDCGAHWLYRGDRCPGTSPMDKFDNAAVEGAVVRISNQSCSAGQTCPGEICGVISKTSIGYGDYMSGAGMLPFVNANCDGKVGKFITIQLPGPKRIFSVEYVHVNRKVPVGATQDDFICLALTPVDQTAVLPEYELSDDPFDPIYYSTCYAREYNIQFLATAPIPAEKRWRFPMACLDCADYQANAAIPDSQTSFPAMKWHTTVDQCKDCAREEAGIHP